MEIINLPPQQLPFSKKKEAWRKKHLDWADGRSFINYSPVRNSILHKKINYDLISGKLHMEDLVSILNPHNLEGAGFTPDDIQHYPIMNSKLNVLRGEESKRNFDYRVVITNPTSLNSMQEEKTKEIHQKIKDWVTKEYDSPEESEQALANIQDYFNYKYMDFREMRANALINHYDKELNFTKLFNSGFVDAMTVAEEMYICDIIGGEPTIERLNPLKVSVFKSGYSSNIEDADMIVIEDYWSPGKIIDTYFDAPLLKKDIDYIEKLSNSNANTHVDEMDNIDERFMFIDGRTVTDNFSTDEKIFWDPFNMVDGISNSLMPYDMAGNIRVLRVFWKSRRKIKKVKSYDSITGEEIYRFYPETYVLNKSLGEEEEIFYINEAWEGTKIGSEIYVNMRPRTLQFNRISNPSRCHFGIVGSIYNVNEGKPFSLVDRMKPYNYLYNVIHDRLNKLLSRTWGNLIRYDTAKIPKDWDIEKWVYYAKTMGIAVENSFNEGMVGAATGKLAGALNNNSTGVIPTSDGNTIQQYIQLMEFIKMEMAEVSGISPQREGQVSNRETAGGIERSNLQSSHITEWLFLIHEDVKKRAIECFLEVAKAAIKGRNKKFNYILNDGSKLLMDIDGDEFAENDYGLVVDVASNSEEFKQKIEMLAQAALQTQTLNFSTIMRLYGTASLAEKQRLVEINEKQLQEQQQQQQQQQSQLQQQQMQQMTQIEQQKMQQQDLINQRDNETKIMIAEINSRAEAQRFAMMNDDAQRNAELEMSSQQSKEELMEKMRQFDAKIALERDKLSLQRTKNREDARLKEKQLSIQRSKTNNSK